jgi:hypothetical protein
MGTVLRTIIPTQTWEQAESAGLVDPCFWVDEHIGWFIGPVVFMLYFLWLIIHSILARNAEAISEGGWHKYLIRYPLDITDMFLMLSIGGLAMSVNLYFGVVLPPFAYLPGVNRTYHATEGAFLMRYRLHLYAVSLFVQTSRTDLALQVHVLV